MAVLFFAGVMAYWLSQMAGLDISRDATAQAGLRNLAELKGVWIGSGLMWAALTVFFLRLTKGRHPTDRFGRDAILILTVAAGLRLILLFTHAPGLSDDLWRYLFDGQTLAHGANPYLVAPAEVSRDEPRFAQEAELASRVNNPELVTIYLPVSQLVFAGSSLAANAVSLDVDGQAVLMRAVFVGFDLVAVGFILLLLRRQGRSAWWAVLYAWHPLAISEIAGSGHQDVIGIMLMLGALHQWSNQPRRVARWTIPLAIAGCVKPITIPVAMMMLRKKPAREWTISVLTGAVVCAVLFGIFLLPQGGLPGQRLFETVTQFVTRWAFHGSIYAPLVSLTENPDRARWICLGLLGMVLVVIWLLETEVMVGARAFMLAALLFSTTAHPWYLLWALALVPLVPSPAVWVASLTLPWGYMVLGDVIGWTVPGWLPWLTYLPIYIALVADWVWRIHRANTSG